MLPGVGYLLAGLVVLGGLVFNIGNVAGSGLGTDAMFGLDAADRRRGLGRASRSAIFLGRRAGVALDRVVVLLGVVMIVADRWSIAVTTSPPVGEALRRRRRPRRPSTSSRPPRSSAAPSAATSPTPARTGCSTPASPASSTSREITRSSVVGILVTGLMRVLLFLAILGVVAGGVTLATPTTRPAPRSSAAAGEAGLRVFGVILWSAAITSVIGAAYTSVSFLTTSRDARAHPQTCSRSRLHRAQRRRCSWSSSSPGELLVFAGTFNGLILPIGFGVLLWVAWRRRDLLGGYRYPAWLLADRCRWPGC